MCMHVYAFVAGALSQYYFLSALKLFPNATLLLWELVRKLPYYIQQVVLLCIICMYMCVRKYRVTVKTTRPKRS